MTKIKTKYTFVCGNYTSAEYVSTKEAMDYADDNIEAIRNEGGRDYPIQIVDNNGDVVAERGYISREELSTWECV